MRKSVGMALGVMLLGALTACDNNPLKEGRDEGDYMYTNPSFATMVVGGTIKVRANVYNKYTAPTGDAVTATPCNSRISAVSDTSLTEFEQPDRFVVTANAVGSSCLVVSGGGVTDTVGFLVGPAGVKLTAAAALASGGTAPLDVTFQNLAGTNITGLSAADVQFISRTPTIVFVDSTTNTIQGRAPGSAWVVSQLRNGRGAIVRDSVLVTVSVGTFSGTFSPTPFARGALMTFTAGNVPFDANTTVTVNGEAVLMQGTTTATTLTFVAPSSAGANAVVVISNIGPNEVASTFTTPFANEAGEPDSFAAPRPLVIGTTYYGSLSGTDLDDFYVVTPAANQTVTANVQWVGATAGTNDVDVLVYRPNGTFFNTSCATAAKPESCTMNLVAGTTYIFNVNRYEGTFTQPYVFSVK